MPNAGYEISDTRRYKDHGKKVEACLVATKNWQVGDELRLCTGMIANLNPSEDAMLRQGEKDFSIMWSTRKGCSCLFLGPARFVNVSLCFRFVVVYLFICLLYIYIYIYVV